MSLRDLFEVHGRPNRIHSSWEPIPEEAAVRASPPDVLDVVEELTDADPALARYVCWLVFDALSESDLAVIAGAQITNTDARIVVGLFLVGAVPSAVWLRPTIADIAASSVDASRNMQPTLDVLRGYVDDPKRFEPEGALEAGLALFEAGDYFEAHEVWEDIWRVVRDPVDFAFFQALINVAVGLKKAREGNATGLERLMSRAGTLMQSVPDVWRGIDVAKLRSQVASSTMSGKIQIPRS